jgi:hypothetical protein
MCAGHFRLRSFSHCCVIATVGAAAAQCSETKPVKFRSIPA